LNYQQIRSFDVPLPPVPEQHEIASALGSIDEKVGVLTAKQERYQTLKRGLMQKLLTGEWRVSVDASATGT
jgi:type I restriction enzyme S subunit